ncbi:MAG: phycobiliprotein lyase [Coleofasciculaceae cyanobacterium SM2_3_26]|nr:phycobiliprotein lyase [Coleofasciculaceae cyanobacterium SM2_3_26]
MLSFPNFFAACSGRWITERTYHYAATGRIERSHTEYVVEPMTEEKKQDILSLLSSTNVKVDVKEVKSFPGFAIHFDTVSDIGERVSMSLSALFVADAYVLAQEPSPPLLPVAAQLDDATDLVRGYYLRDEGYYDAGMTLSRFTYQPVRQTLEMTTFYRASVAVDQMRFVAPDTRLRTIVTYQRPSDRQPPVEIQLVGFGVEHRQPA